MPIVARMFVAALIVVIAAARPASAQTEDPAQLLEDFVHYALIAKPDLAASYAEKLLNSGLTNAELAVSLDEMRGATERFDQAVLRAQFIPELENIASDLAMRVERGRLDLARDPKRVEEAIGKLTGNIRQQRLAHRRLEEAGEYSVPSLLRVLTEGRDEQLKIAAEKMLRQIGRQAVTPLCVALPNIDPVTQRIVCDIVGEISYPHAAPYLRELAANAQTRPPVSDAARRAVSRLAEHNAGADVSSLYASLGRQYLNNVVSLTAFPGEELNNVWSYDAHIGLTAMPVPTAVFSEIMAMQMASRSLHANQTNSGALSLFVAANLKRENDLPAGATDPIYGELQYSPAFYATVFGTRVCMDVLAMALDMFDTPLVRDAIAALNQTTGGSNLFSGAGVRNPLLESLQYPDRRVQYESAMTLGRALPQETFNGDFRVVPLLASAVRTGSQSFALVVGDDNENRRVIAGQLEALGFSVIGSGMTIDDLALDISRSVGVDIAVVRVGNADSANGIVSNLRLLARTAATPILLMGEQTDKPALDRQYQNEARVLVSRAGIGDEAFGNAVDSLLLAASGGRITEAQAEAYAIDSLDTLRNIALTRSPAYSIVDAEASLLEALETRTGGTKNLVAEILALIDSEEAQRKLFDAALAATDSEQIMLLDQVAESVKRFGNRADQWQVNGLLDLVVNSGGSTAEAAARVHGALNLPSGAAVDLIP